MATIITPHGTFHTVNKPFAVVYRKESGCVEFETQSEAEQFAMKLAEMSYLYRVEGPDSVVIQIRMGRKVA